MGHAENLLLKVVVANGTQHTGKEVIILPALRKAEGRAECCR